MEGLRKIRNDLAAFQALLCAGAQQTRRHGMQRSRIVDERCSFPPGLLPFTVADFINKWRGKRRVRIVAVARSVADHPNSVAVKRPLLSHAIEFRGCAAIAEQYRGDVLRIGLEKEARGNLPFLEYDERQSGQAR
jgi:hypothetical protein